MTEFIFKYAAAQMKAWERKDDVKRTTYKPSMSNADYEMFEGGAVDGKNLTLLTEKGKKNELLER